MEWLRHEGPRKQIIGIFLWLWNLYTSMEWQATKEKSNDLLVQSFGPQSFHFILLVISKNEQGRDCSEENKLPTKFCSSSSSSFSQTLDPVFFLWLLTEIFFRYQVLVLKLLFRIFIVYIIDIINKQNNNVSNKWEKVKALSKQKSLLKKMLENGWLTWFVVCMISKLRRAVYM